MTAFRITVHTEFDAELERAWRALEGVSDVHVFQTYDWNALWYECVGSRTHRIVPCIATVRAGDEPVLLFPFGIRRQFGVRLLEFLGGGQADYLMPLADRRVLAELPLADIWRQVDASLPAYDVRMLQRIPETLDGGPNPFLAVWSSRPMLQALAATLPDSWAGMEARIPAKLRADTRRQLRRLADRGEVQFRIAATEVEYQTFLDAMFIQKGRRYRETGVRDILADPNVREFYRRARSALGRGYVSQMSALVCNGEPIATHWGIVHPDRYYFLMPSFAAGEMAAYSPGRILQEKLLQWAIEHRIPTFDFTVGAEEYKRAWCDRTVRLYQHDCSTTTAGALLVAALRTVHTVKTDRRARAAVTACVRAWRRATGARG